MSLNFIQWTFNQKIIYLKKYFSFCVSYLSYAAGNLSIQFQRVCQIAKQQSLRISSGFAEEAKPNLHDVNRIADVRERAQHWSHGAEHRALQWFLKCKENFCGFRAQKTMTQRSFKDAEDIYLRYFGSSFSKDLWKILMLSSQILVSVLQVRFIKTVKQCSHPNKNNYGLNCERLTVWMRGLPAKNRLLSSRSIAR